MGDRGWTPCTLPSAKTSPRPPNAVQAAPCAAVRCGTRSNKRMQQYSGSLLLIEIDPNLPCELMKEAVRCGVVCTSLCSRMVSLNAPYTMRASHGRLLTARWHVRISRQTALHRVQLPSK